MDSMMRVPVRDVDLLAGLDLPLASQEDGAFLTPDGTLYLQLSSGSTHSYGDFMTLGEGIWRLEVSGTDAAFIQEEGEGLGLTSDARRLAAEDLPGLFTALRRAVMDGGTSEAFRSLHEALYKQQAHDSETDADNDAVSPDHAAEPVSGLHALARPVLETLQQGLDEDPLLAAGHDADAMPTELRQPQNPQTDLASHTDDTLDAMSPLLDKDLDATDADEAPEEDAAPTGEHSIAIGNMPADQTALLDNESPQDPNVQPVPPGPLGTLIDSSIQLGIAGGRMARDLVARSKGAINADQLNEYVASAAAIAAQASGAWHEIRNTLLRGESYNGSLLHTRLTQALNNRTEDGNTLDPTTAVQMLAAKLQNIDGILASKKGQRVLHESPEIQDALSSLQHVSRTLSSDILSLGKEAGKSLRIAANSNDQEAEVAAKIKIPMMLFGATKAAESIEISLNSIFARIGHRLVNAFRSPAP